MSGLGPTVSVVVVSRERPVLLRRCLRGLAQLRYPRIEIVVVACPLGLAQIAGLGWQDRVKTVAFDTPNISAARNLGIARAGGDIVAFLDDDAVPEPMWLAHLVRAFDDPGVVAAGGFTLARNGIEIGHRGTAVTPEARETPVAVDEETPTVLPTTPERGIKLEGTNMAFRRETLVALSGFDPAYRFYLDETDLALRLARAGVGSVAVVPRAVMHHGVAPSARRRGDKVATTLREVGASLAVFLRRHAPDADADARIAEERAARRAALLRHMVAGRIEPRDVGRVLATFDAGVAEGRARPLAPLAPLPDAPGFLAYVPDPPQQGHRRIAARWADRKTARAEAAGAAAAGHIVSLYLISRTALYHRTIFTAKGVWEQRGGLWGRSLRSDPLVRSWRFGARVEREFERVQPARDPRAL